MIQFNSTGLSLQPTQARWVQVDTLGITGNGRAIYPALREFEMVFNLSNQQNLYELHDYFNQIATGTIVASLPEWGSPVFRYKNYSGVLLREPAVGDYFAEEYTQEVKMTLLVRI